MFYNSVQTKGIAEPKQSSLSSLLLAFFISERRPFGRLSFFIFRIMRPLHPKIAAAYEVFSDEITSLFLSARDIIISESEGFTDELKFGLPFLYYQKKMFCYFWQEKKTGQPYIGFMEGHRSEHPLLIAGDRTRVKILPIDPEADLPYESLLEIIQELMSSPYYEKKR